MGKSKAGSSSRCANVGLPDVEALLETLDEYMFLVDMRKKRNFYSVES